MNPKSSRSGSGTIDSRKLDSCETGRLIKEYSWELSHPPCSAETGRWSVNVVLEDDIRQVLPYLNSELKDGVYDHDAGILIWKDSGKKYAFRAREIAVGPVRGRKEGAELTGAVISLVNDTWRRRKQIQPEFDRKKIPDMISLFKLLPGTNCKECARPSCMAFAADLREDMAELSRCPHLTDEGRRALSDLF